MIELHSQVRVGEGGGPGPGGPQRLIFLARDTATGRVYDVSLDLTSIVSDLIREPMFAGESHAELVGDPPPSMLIDPWMRGLCPGCGAGMIAERKGNVAKVRKGYRCGECGKRGPFDLVPERLRIPVSIHGPLGEG